MNAYEIRQNILASVREDGRNLQYLGEVFRDDEEIVATAILGRDFGGISVLQYASGRLQNSPKLLELSQLTKVFQDKRQQILSMDIPADQKKSQLEKIEEQKVSFLKKYFRKKDYYLDSIDIPSYLKHIIDIYVFMVYTVIMIKEQSF